MKNVSIRIPEPGPLGEIFFEANALAIAWAFFLNSPGGGWVESVLTLAIHLLAGLLGGVKFELSTRWVQQLSAKACWMSRPALVG